MNEIEINNKFKLIKKLCKEDPNNIPEYLQFYTLYITLQLSLDDP